MNKATKNKIMWGAGIAVGAIAALWFFVPAAKEKMQQGWYWLRDTVTGWFSKK